MKTLSNLIEKSRSTFFAAGLAPKAGWVIEKEHIDIIMADPRVRFEQVQGEKNGVKAKLSGLFWEGNLLAAEMTQESDLREKQMFVPSEHYDRMKTLILAK